MSLLQPLPEPVPLEEAAAVLDRVARQARGGPMAAVLLDSRQLVAALEAAGFQITRREPSSRQLTL